MFFKVCPFMAALYYKSFYFIVFITKSAQNWITWPFLLSSPPFRMLESFTSQHHLRAAVRLSILKPPHKLLCSFSLFSESRLSVPIVGSYSVSCCNVSFPGHTENPCPSCAVALRGAAS